MSRDPFTAQLVSPSTTPPASGVAPAVEIVTALGDSVLEVDQLTPAPAPSARARMFLTIGGGLLLAAATTFGLGVRDAASEARAREQWRKQERPTWAFRPAHHNPAADFLTFGGGLAGLGLCAAGLLAKRRPAKTSFKVGIGDHVDVPVGDAGRSHTLVEADGQGGFVVDITGLTGELRSPDRVVALAELQASGQLQVPVRVDTHVRALLGRTTFHVRGMAAATRPVGPAPFLVAQRPLAFFVGSAAAHLALLALMSTVSPDQESVPLEMRVDDDNRQVAIDTSHEELPPLPPEDGADDDGASVPSPEASMALTDGTLGHTDGSANPAHLQVADRGLTPQMSRDQAIAAASAAGVLGAMEFVGPVRTLDGMDVASGMDAIDFAGGLQDGGGDGVPVGSFGWGVSGFGAGCGTIGGKLCQGYRAGNFATIGGPGHDGSNLRLLPGFGPGPGKRVGAVPKVTEIGKPVACSEDNPCLDPAIIRRYIHRSIEKISYCYESQLLGNPTLAGTVTANFTLNGNGTVIDSRAAGVAPAVSTCIASVISNIHFPKVGDTGIYPIKYPFTMRPTGK